MIALIERPYFRSFSNGLQVSCYFLNCATAAAGIAVSYGVPIPSYAFIILGVVNLAVPLAFIITEIVYMIKESRKAKRDRKAGIKPKKIPDEDKQVSN